MFMLFSGIKSLIMKPLNLYSQHLLLFLVVGCSMRTNGDTCSSSNYSAGSAYKVSLRDLASALVSASSYALYTNASSAPSSPQPAYGMFQCRGDASQKECSACVKSSIERAMSQTCPSSVGANLQQDHCHVRYDNNPALFDGTSPDTNLWYYVWNLNQIADARYQNDVITALENVTGTAPYKSNYYASTRVGLAFALAQCDRYLSRSQCYACLSPVADALKYLNKSEGGGIFYGSCFYTYDSHLFFRTTVPSSPPADSNHYSQIQSFHN